MAFDISRFYQDLDACYGNHDNAATEAFLKKSRDVADRAGAPMPVNTGCSKLCDTAGAKLGICFRVQ